MAIIRIDKKVIEGYIEELESILKTYPEHGGKTMTAAVYASINTYRRVLRMAPLAEKKLNKNQLTLKLK